MIMTLHRRAWAQDRFGEGPLWGHRIRRREPPDSLRNCYRWQLWVLRLV